MTKEEQAIEFIEKYMKLDEKLYNTAPKETVSFIATKKCLEFWDMAIKALKQTTWIPCSKRLPEDNGWYHCTADLDDLLLTVDLYYKNGKWLDNRRINMFDCYDIYGYGNTTEKHKLSYQELISEFDWTANVIAWMPLIESYVPEMSHEDGRSEI